jgi:hypothetical protein
MLAHSKKKTLVTAVVLAIAGTSMVHGAWARVVRNTIDSVAVLTDSGRGLIVTGPIECSESQATELEVTVTQRQSGAVAHGRARITCSPTSQQWEVRAQIQGNETFQEGPATAVAMARSSVGGRADDAQQWLVNVTIVRK